jgi:membrane protease YdiL (CAAX protease family)
MLGLLVILVVSWGLLYLFEKENINAIGIFPNAKRVIQFVIGMLFIMVVCLLNIAVETMILKVEWKLQHPINYTAIFEALIYHIKSALTEDLVFRGAILYILIKKIGAKWGIFLSALVFGIYHVFSYGIGTQSIVLIVYVVSITGFVGFVWAYAFHKTQSIYIGLGFHIGFNMMNTFFFQNQPYGELIFESVNQIKLSEWHKLYFLIFKGLFPSIITFIGLKIWLRISNINTKL